MSNHAFQNNQVACIIDADNGGVIAICKTPEDADAMLQKYVEDQYCAPIPELVEDVWVEFVNLNEFIY